MKWIITDLDGTLLRSDGSVSARTQAALDRARKRDARLAFASARGIDGMRPYIRRLRPDAVIAYGGALLMLGGAELWRAQLDACESDRLLAALCATPEVITVEFEGEPEYGHIIGRPPIGPFHRPAYQISAELTRAERLDELRGRFPQYAVCGYDGEAWVRFAHRDARKERAMEELCRRTGVSVSEVAAFGDDLMDAAMLVQCGCGVAMGNAAASVKAAARFVTADNDSDGVAVFLEEGTL